MRKKYIRTIIVEAVPKTLGDYCAEKYGESTTNEDKNGYKLSEDGYTSRWLPKEVFEKQYKEIRNNNMTFGEALEEVKKGYKISRRGWNGKGMWIELQVPDDYSKMTRPYIYHVAPKGSTNHYGENAKEFERVPWLPSNTDILADDWNIVE